MKSRWPLATERLVLRPFTPGDLVLQWESAVHKTGEIGFIFREAHFVENEWVKGEWQSELVYAILDREWHA